MCAVCSLISVSNVTDCKFTELPGLFQPADFQKPYLNLSVVCFCSQGKNIIVFYGSQTGTGEEFANRLSKDAQRYGMKGMAADPEEYDMVNSIPSIAQIIGLYPFLQNG